MSMEIESKFIVRGKRACDEIRALRSLGAYTLGSSDMESVRDDYLDTADRALLAAGYACRKREREGVLLLTVKSLGAAQDEVHRREELEVILPADGLPAGWPPSAARDTVLALTGGKPLEALFSLGQIRHVRAVLDGDRRVATSSLDEVSLRLPGVTRRWHELEVELAPSGTEEDLAAISRWIRDTLGLSPAAGSKFEKAFAAVKAGAGRPRSRPKRRSGAASEASAVFEAFYGPAPESPFPALARMGYTARLRRQLTDDVTFFDTHDGAFMKRGFALSFAQGRGTWRLSEDGKALAEERGEKATLPLEGPLASALGTIPSALPTLALLEATLTDSQYRLTGFAARALRIRTRLWMFRSPLEPAAARGLLRLEASGPVTELSYFSSLLQTRLGFQPARGSVLVKGLALLGHSAPGSGMPAEFRVRPRDSAMDACRAILRGEAWRMRANAPGAMRDLDPEFVHDLRVATRRARSALRLFAEILPAEELLKLRGELGWIARLLGGVRDLDVLGMRLDAVATHPTLRESLRRSREGAQAALAAELQSERFAALLAAVESTGGAPQAGGERGAGDIAKSGFQDLAQTRRNRPAGRFARSRIERIFRKLSPWVARPADDLTDVELHRVRILFKRLRYACEFFRPLLGKDAGSLIEAFVEYQDCLGLHQDAITAERLLTETLEKIPNESRSEDFLLSMGALLQLQRDARQTQREEFVRRWRSAPELLVVWKGVRKNREVSHESSRGL